jgi:hypothetical protein
MAEGKEEGPAIAEGGREGEERGRRWCGSEEDRTEGPVEGSVQADCGCQIH